MKLAFRQVRRGVLLLLVVLVTSVAGHYWITGGPLIDSAYWAVITLSTVGYAHTPPVGMSTFEKAFSIGVITVGTFAVAYLVGMVLQATVEGKIQQAMGMRRMTSQISKLGEHVVICGYGRIGQYLAGRLAKQQADLVVIDRDPEAVNLAREAGHLCIEGDASSEETLAFAAIERARTLVVALHSDADNVFLTLTARNMNPELHILARGEQQATEKKLKQAGADQVVMPALIGARQIADMILRPHAAHLIYGAGPTTIDATMEEVQIEEGSHLVGKTIRDAETRQKYNVLIVAVRRVQGDLLFNPPADIDFQAGDTLIVIGESNDVEGFLSQCSRS